MDEKLQCTVTECILSRIISTQSVDCDVVMSPFAVSLKAGSITGVPMSLGYGGYQSTTPPPCYTTTTFSRTVCYTEAHYYYTIKAPEYYTEADAAPSYNIKRTTPKLPSTKTTKSPEYYTYVAPACCTEAPKYYLVPSYYTEAPTYYTTKAAEYYTEPPKYYTNKAPEYYNTTCASPSLYTEAPKYYSALSYTTTTEAAKYYAAPTYYTAAAPSYYVESEYYT